LPSRRTPNRPGVIKVTRARDPNHCSTPPNAGSCKRESLPAPGCAEHGVCGLRRQALGIASRSPANEGGCVRQIKRILCPLDFPGPCNLSFDHARALDRHYAADLLMERVVEPLEAAYP
jgi:hypothetical protein